eukprot:scaffold235885_cov20-Prasinocladus_malaysianus.AAC.1
MEWDKFKWLGFLENDLSVQKCYKDANKADKAEEQTRMPQSKTREKITCRKNKRGQDNTAIK